MYVQYINWIINSSKVRKRNLRSHVLMTYHWPVSDIISPPCSSFISSWRVVCIKATVMYHCLTLLPPSPCPLTYNLILTFPHTLGSSPLSTFVTSLTFTRKGNHVLVAGGWQAPLVNLHLFSCSYHSEKLLWAIECLLFLPNLRVFISWFFFSFSGPSTHHFKHTVWCPCPRIHRVHPIHFKECEKWVLKSNLTKGGLESMGDALLCKGLMVCSDWGLYISAFWDLLCSCWTAQGERLQGWHKNTVSCEPNHGPNSKVCSTAYSMCLCEMIHEWHAVFEEICSKTRHLPF